MTQTENTTEFMSGGIDKDIIVSITPITQTLFLHILKNKLKDKLWNIKTN